MRALPHFPRLRRTAKIIGRCRRDRRGIAAVELALASPVLLSLFVGTTEIAHFLSVHYQASQMASTVADAVARYDMVTAQDISGIFSASSSVMDASDFGSKGYVILTSVSRKKTTDSPTITWQCKGGGTAVQASRVGATKGAAATLPGTLTMDADDNVIVAEVFYGYSTLFDFIPIADTTVYKNAVFRPRLGALTTVPGC
jgi:Flp pilus assembly protein TadG